MASVEREHVQRLLEVPLTQVLRPEIALTLKHMMSLYTVGGLLRAWDEPAAQRCIEQVFSSVDEARTAVAACAAWCGQAPIMPIQQFGWLGHGATN